jgi:phytoene dehydrogenase-like protein
MVDAAVVGSGPNGLSAAIALARAGVAVRVHETQPTLGGGSRSAGLTLPGFVHDVCSAIHPMAVASPFFAGLGLSEHGLEWIHPEIAVAHPLDGGTAVALVRSLEETAEGLGADAKTYRRIVGPLAARFQDLIRDLLGPIARVPRHPLLMAQFGRRALLPAASLGFRDERARALVAGLAAHSFLPLEAPFTASFALIFAAATHASGWPLARGGSQRIADALASLLRGLGGEISVGDRVDSLDRFGAERAILFDTSAATLERIAGARLPARYRRALRRFRRGPGVFKLDYALSGPVPWSAPECRRAGTVHVGGTFAEIAASEARVAAGGHPERPFVLVAQQSLFDPTRAPPGKHTLWAYCHVPNGSEVDMTARIEAQLERFAPGFADVVLARAVTGPGKLEAYNANCAGGDISGGAYGGMQFFARPVLAFDPYATPAPNLYLCSSSTPPGAGVHGMCGLHAAQSALRRSFGIR